MPRRYEVDPQGPFIPDDTDFVSFSPWARTTKEISAGVTPTNYAYLPGDVRRYGADTTGAVSSTTAFQNATNTTHAVLIPEGTFAVSGVSYTGKIVWVGQGSRSIIQSDSTVLTVTSGTESAIDNLRMENITAPWIITRDPTNWAAVITGTLQQSNSVLGYQPTINDADIWGTLTAGQQNQDVGPKIIFKSNAQNIEVSRIYGRFVVIELYDAIYSSVHDCNYRAGKGQWGGVNFDNVTFGGQSGIGNSAYNNVITYASYNGITFQNNDRPLITDNNTSLCGESGIKAAGGATRKCIRAVVADNVCAQNYYDGIDLVTSFPTNTTTEALHKATGNFCYQNGGDGINADGKYTALIDNTIERNYRYGLWCPGSFVHIEDNLLIDNNQERNASNHEILGGGDNGSYIVGNRIQMGAGANSSAIFYDKTGYAQGNYAQGGSFFFGLTPTSFLENNIDDLTGLQHTQSFVLNLTNTAGTMQHAFFSQTSALSVSSLYVNRINSVSATLANTPTGADGATAFVSGGKIGSASTNRFWIDTAVQVIAYASLMTSVIYNDSGTAILCRPQLASLNINGVTRVRLVFDFVNAASGAAFALTPANVGAGKTIQVQFLGKLS